MGKDDFLGDVEEDDGDGEVIEVDSQEVTEVTPAPAPEAENSLVKPVADIQAISKTFKRFEEVKDEILTNDDKQKIGGNWFVTKSGWRKIATAFNVSVDVVNKEKTVEDGVLTWQVEARATAPNGKTATSWAACASNESNHMEKLKNVSDEDKERDDVFRVDGKFRRLKPPREVNEHNILATAETRAKNRAISDLVGGGQVSAEEITKEDVLE